MAGNGEKKSKLLTSTIAASLLFVLGALAKPVIEDYIGGYVKSRVHNKDKIRVEVNGVLDKYSEGLNTHHFNAYDLFSNPVEQFINMKNTSPAEINDYIDRCYYRQFQKPTVTFDKQSLVINYTDQNGMQADVIENEEYVRATTGKLETHQIKTRIHLTKDYKIKVFDLYKVIH